MVPEPSRVEVGALAALPFAAAADLVGCVEGVHLAVAERAFGPTGPMAAPVRLAHHGVATGVYAATRVLVGLIGRGVALAANAAVPPEARELSRSRRGGAVVAAVNGWAGDRLASDGSELAIPMALRVDCRDVAVAADDLRRAYPGAGGRLALFVHGLCGSEHGWEGQGDSYGERLRADLGHTPVSVRYNTGLHVSESGRSLAWLLEDLIDAWPAAVEEIVLVGHSMGGLVVRSACHYGGLSGHRWVGMVRHVFYLGTPHLGAPMEKAANVTGSLLALLPETRPLARLWNLRSAGIKDLRFGSLLDDDWMGRDADALLQDTCAEVPLLETAGHYSIGATITRDAAHPLGYVLGDLLVRLPSASGQGAARRVQFDLGSDSHLGGLHHFDLLHHPRIYEQMRRWIGGA